jgi:tRNA 2-thiocytidine biosynthesis protein TtcA
MNSADPRKSRHEAGILQQRLRRHVGRAIADFNMIEEGDRVMVCLSGGKDSYTLLEILQRLRERAPIHFDLIAVHLDQKQPGYPPEIMAGYLRELGIEHHIIEQDTYSVVKRVVPEGNTMCGLCSRLRRGILYTFAAQHGMTKIALGHHRDDIVETLFLNMFFGSKLKAMPPKLLSDDGKHVVIRPLAYCAERHRALCRVARLSDHSLQPVRQPAAPAAGQDQEHAGELGSRAPGTRGEYLPQSAVGGAVPSRRPGPVRVPRAGRQGR